MNNEQRQLSIENNLDNMLSYLQNPKELKMNK